jgi:hypothetical protein
MQRGLVKKRLATLTRLRRVASGCQSSLHTPAQQKTRPAYFWIRAAPPPTPMLPHN